MAKRKIKPLALVRAEQRISLLEKNRAILEGLLEDKTTQAQGFLSEVDNISGENVRLHERILNLEKELRTATTLNGVRADKIMLLENLLRRSGNTSMVLASIYMAYQDGLTPTDKLRTFENACHRSGLKFGDLGKTPEEAFLSGYALMLKETSNLLRSERQKKTAETQSGVQNEKDWKEELLNEVVKFLEKEFGLSVKIVRPGSKTAE